MATSLFRSLRTLAGRAALLAACAGTSQSVLSAEFTGLIIARHDILVSPGVAGAVLKVPAVVGQRVKEGQLMLQIDDRLQALEAQRRRQIFEDDSELRAARDRLRILTPLYEDSRKAFLAGGSVSREELSRLELDWSAAVARVDQLVAQKAREKAEFEIADQERILRKIVAPVEGVVTRVELEIGEWAKPGEPVLQIVDAEVCYLKVNVTPAALRAVRRDQTMTVQFEPVLRLPPARGRVTFVSPAIDPASGLVELRVTLQNPGWKIPPGVKASVTLEEGD